MASILYRGRWVDIMAANALAILYHQSINNHGISFQNIPVSAHEIRAWINNHNYTMDINKVENADIFLYFLK